MTNNSIPPAGAVRVMFSVNEYDREGDVTERAIFLHFGKVRVAVADDLEGFRDFIDGLHSMVGEIAENYPDATK